MHSEAAPRCTLADLARARGMLRSSLKDVVGDPWTDYVTRSRMMLAAAVWHPGVCRSRASRPLSVTNPKVRSALPMSGVGKPLHVAQRPHLGPGRRPRFGCRFSSLGHERWQSRLEVIQPPGQRSDEGKQMARKHPRHGPYEDPQIEEEDTPVAAAPCWLCGRPTGETIVWHHPVPKSRGGRDVVPMHPICQQTLTVNFTNSELQRHGMDVDGLLASCRAQIRRLGSEQGPGFHCNHLEEEALMSMAFRRGAPKNS